MSQKWEVGSGRDQQPQDIVGTYVRYRFEGRTGVPAGAGRHERRTSMSMDTNDVSMSTMLSAHAIALTMVNGGIIILLSLRCASASATLPSAFLHRPTAASLRSTSPPLPSSRKDDVYIAFPGGGLFFYWQAGVIVSVYIPSQHARPWIHILSPDGIDHFFNSFLHEKIFHRPICNKKDTICPNLSSLELPRVPYRQLLPK